MSNIYDYSYCYCIPQYAGPSRLLIGYVKYCVNGKTVPVDNVCNANLFLNWVFNLSGNAEPVQTDTNEFFQCYSWNIQFNYNCDTTAVNDEIMGVFENMKNEAFEILTDNGVDNINSIFNTAFFECSQNPNLGIYIYTHNIIEQYHDNCCAQYKKILTNFTAQKSGPLIRYTIKTAEIFNKDENPCS